VLFLSAQHIFPPRSGGHIRSRGLVGAFKRHGLDVFVYSLVGRKEDYLARRRSSVQTWPEGVEEYVDRGLLGFLLQYASYALGWPPLWIPSYLRIAAASPGERLLPALLRERLAWCDVVVADFPYPYPVFAAPSARDRLRILSTHNIDHHLFRPGGWGRPDIREAVRRTEIAAASACDILVSCCDGDREFFERNARVRRSILVPNGIDVRRFRNLEGYRAAARRQVAVDDDVTVFLFTASKWGPNCEAFDELRSFASDHSELLVRERIHILVVGSVVSDPVRMPGLTATGPVDAVEPYFAAADAALNPTRSGAGTSLKMCEYLASRLPIVTTAFGARGFRIDDGRTGFLFDEGGLARVLSTVRRLTRQEPQRLRRMAEDAYAENEAEIDMDASAGRLVLAIREALGAAGPSPRLASALEEDVVPAAPGQEHVEGPDPAPVEARPPRREGAP
jgi:glycosyltransferase involved in cell wall biosynthesis